MSSVFGSGALHQRAHYLLLPQYGQPPGARLLMRDQCRILRINGPSDFTQPDAETIEITATQTV